MNFQSTFGSNLTDAQSAWTQGDQIANQADAQKKAYLAQVMQGLLKQRQMGQQQQMFQQEMAQRGGQDQQANLLQALGLAIKQRMGDQQDTLGREGLASAERIATTQFPLERWRQENERVAAERVRQEAYQKRLEDEMDMEVEQQNQYTAGRAAQYNALLNNIKQEATKKAEAETWAMGKDANTDRFKNRYKSYLDQGVKSINQMLLEDKDGASINYNPAAERFEPLLRKTRRGAVAPGAGDQSSVIKEAENAIARGADPAAVIARLQQKFGLAIPGAPQAQVNAAPPPEAAFLQMLEQARASMSPAQAPPQRMFPTNDVYGPAYSPPTQPALGRFNLPTDAAGVQEWMSNALR